MRQKLCVGEESVFGLGRRDILNQFGLGFGGLALSHMLASPSSADHSISDKTHFPAKAERVIYLFQSGGPSQMDLYDYKPVLKEKHGQQLPDDVRRGQRLTGMSGNQSSFPLGGSPFKFSQHGQSGQWFSEVLPHTAKIADDLCVVKSMYTEAINHGPGVTMLQTGSQFPGRPSIGSWLSYGLGTANEDLPSFVVMVTKNKGGQPLVSRLWGSGFLPSKFQGVRLRSGKDPVLYLNIPQGISRESRRKMLDKLHELHRAQVDANSDPIIENRISEYELAFRMQSSVPDVTDISNEPKHVLDLYGKGVDSPGSFAANCLQARRLAERGVRFIQLYHPGWDQHGGLMGGIKGQCSETDQASAGLITDLKQRGMLDDTLVVWGGEFGRTCYSQGKLNGNNFGRDHHPRCFSLWMAGGGTKGGHSYGSTDDLGYNIESNPVHVHDFHATMLHLLGIDHERLTFRYQGRRFRLTDVHGKVVTDLLA